MINQESLHQEYTKIDQRISDVVNFLEKHKDSKKYKDLYKGISTIQSPIIYEPEILFIDINNGDETYKEANKASSKSENITPLKWYNNSDTELPTELNWLKKGNAHGCYTEPEGKKWKGYEWFDREQETNNPFPKNMIDLFYEIAKLKYPEADHNYDGKSVPFWYDDLVKNVMHTNLYPISTSKVKQLKPIHVHLAKEPELRALWKKVRGKDEAINESIVRKYFIQSISDLVELVKPKLIVCLGITATKDLTLKDYPNEKLVLTEKTFGENNVPIIGFSREGNWNARIPEIAKAIVG